MQLSRPALFVLILIATFCLSSKSDARPTSNIQEPPAEASKILGSWTGGLDVGAIRLRLVFHIREASGKLIATLDSPDQKAKDIAMDEVEIDGSILNIGSKKMKATYRGTLSQSGDKIDGTWSQSGRNFPLNLTRLVDSNERRRPQTPLGPFPYRVEEVTFRHPTENFAIAGTLTIPHVRGRSPAVVLISGSGAQDRDESIFEHRPFAVLADHLTKAGMIVLRLDDRGVGGTGTDANPQDDTTLDFASDVRAALGYLRSRPEVDVSRIGLIGHSEGALIAPMIASEDEKIAFLILLSGPGVPGHELLSLQSEKIARASGATESDIAELRSLQLKIFGIIRSETDVEKGLQQARQILLEQYDQLSAEEKRLAGSAQAFVDQHSSVIGIPWFRFFITFDPSMVLAKVTCPVLAITGEKDLQVPPEQNLPKIQEAISQGKAGYVKTKVLPGLNHLLQTAKLGLVSEYGEIEETISPVALNEISDWLKESHFIP